MTYLYLNRRMGFESQLLWLLRTDLQKDTSHQAKDYLMLSGCKPPCILEQNCPLRVIQKRFSVVPSDRTRGNEHQLNNKGFHLNSRKHFFTV